MIDNSQLYKATVEELKKLQLQTQHQQEQFYQHESSPRAADAEHHFITAVPKLPRATPPISDLVKRAAEEEQELRLLRAKYQTCTSALERTMKSSSSSAAAAAAAAAGGNSDTRLACEKDLAVCQQQLTTAAVSNTKTNSCPATGGDPSTAIAPMVLPAVAPTRPLLPGITLATHMDPSRLRLEMKEIPQLWAGPVAVAFFASSTKDVDLIDILMKQLQPSVRDRITYSVFSYNNRHNESAYPVNVLRNQALQLVRTELVFLVDGDFVPDSGLYDRVQRNYKPMMEQAQARTAFVVPCFMQGMRFNARPTNQSSLLHQLAEHQVSAPGDPPDRPHHGITDYDKWKQAQDPYPVDYQFWYEPYVIVSLRQAPFYDERFVYYGMDKVAYVYSLHRSGFTFQVLPHHFIIHVPHPRDQWYATGSGVKVSDTDRPKELLKLYLKEWADVDMIKKL